MKKRTYRCKSCGREVIGQGALAHLRIHGIGVGGKLDDVRDQLELVGEMEVLNPNRAATQRKQQAAMQRLMPASQVREVTKAIERQTAKSSVRVVREIERHPTLEIVTDGERVGIVEWRDDLV